MMYVDDVDWNWCKYVNEVDVDDVGDVTNVRNGRKWRVNEFGSCSLGKTLCRNFREHVRAAHENLLLSEASAGVIM